jgi:hypothetical protein
MDSNRRLRIEVILPDYGQPNPAFGGDLMPICEVHVVGKVEPLPFSEDDDTDEQEAMTDEDTDDEDEACKRQ